MFGCRSQCVYFMSTCMYVDVYIAQVYWMLHSFDMREPSHRARFIFAVINLVRWFTLMTKQLPDRRFRVKLLEPWERANGVTITFQAGHR